MGDTLGIKARIFDLDGTLSGGFYIVAFLELVGHPVALNPNAELTKIAGNGWLILRENDRVVDAVKSYLRRKSIATAL